MVPKSNKLQVDQRDPLALEVQAVLEDDLADGAKLMLPKYRRAAIESDSLNGYCAVAAAAFFFLGGGRKAELQPMQRTHRGGSHWWIVKDENVVIDLTLRPGERSRYPYRKGDPRGFVQTGYKRPSKRAQQLITRVKSRRAN